MSTLNVDFINPASASVVTVGTVSFTKTINIPNGAAEGYVLTSDSSGYAYWTSSSVDSSGGVSGTPGYYTKFGAGGTISTSSSVYQSGNNFNVVSCDNFNFYVAATSSKPYFQATKEHVNGGSLTIRGYIGGGSGYLQSSVKIFPDNRSTLPIYNIVSRVAESDYENIGIQNKLITRTNPFDSEYGGFGTGQRIGVQTLIDTISNSTSFGEQITIGGTGSVKYGNWINISGVNSGNSYGLYVNVTQAASNNYGVYVANGISYFGGSVGIGSTVPDSKSILELSSTTKGFLPPRMSETEKLAISTPPVGLIVYQTDATEGLYVYKSTGWTFIA